MRNKTSDQRSGINTFIATIAMFFLWLISLPTPVYAAFDIGGKFGFGKFISLGEVTDKFIPAVFSLSATLVSLYFLFGAFDYARAGSDKEALSKARKMITHSIIGFILLIFAFFVIEFVPQFFEFTGWNIIKN